MAAMTAHPMSRSSSIRSRESTFDSTGRVGSVPPCTGSDNRSRSCTGLAGRRSRMSIRSRPLAHARLRLLKPPRRCGSDAVGRPDETRPIVGNPVDRGLKVSKATSRTERGLLRLLRSTEEIVRDVDAASRIAVFMVWMKAARSLSEAFAPFGTRVTGWVRRPVPTIEGSGSVRIVEFCRLAGARRSLNSRSLTGGVQRQPGSHRDAGGHHHRRHQHGNPQELQARPAEERQPDEARDHGDRKQQVVLHPGEQQEATAGRGDRRLY
jgi:hypothetical protein